MTARWLSVALIGAAMVAWIDDASAQPAPVARYAPKGHPSRNTAAQLLDGTTYLYVAYAQTPTPSRNAGAGAMILQADPALGVADFHSLAEIAVESSDGKQIVEIGWTIDMAVNGDLQPHVFVFHWIDGVPTCYNACGWVQVSPDKLPGMRVVPGEAHRYEIRQINGDWWTLYDGEPMGYFPASEFHGALGHAGLVQWFGEVAAGSAAPCTQMGNGKLGADAASAAFDDLRNFDTSGASAPAAATAGTVTAPSLYNIGRTTASSFGFGGPGAASGCCTPATCQSVQAECGSVADPTCTGNQLACGMCDGCTADHKCPSGYGPRDTGGPFDTPITETAGGGCCDAGASGSGTLVLGSLVAFALRRRRAQRLPR